MAVMCGRFTLHTPAQDIADVFELAVVPDLAPRYNIAPTQAVAAVRLEADRRRTLSLLHWGLIPSWAADPAIGNRMINARAETVASKPAFRQAFQRRRCLVLADGFFEWQKRDGGKQPHHIRLKDGRPFGLAGLWERWERGEQPIESCTIITTGPNELMQSIHDRMPVIVAPGDFDLRLGASPVDRQQLETLLRPFPAAQMEAYPVSVVVNNPRRDAAECIARV
jgi:putative SOS response-associated peptidase YedK